MPTPLSPLRVRSGDLTLAAREHSPSGPGRPTVVLVHGYPDQQQVWDETVARLPLDDLHVVTYDVRGAGSSDAPPSTDGYRTERLVDDLVAVLDAVLPPGTAAHLVGHDWGSVQLWDAVAVEVADPRLTGRIASFTSISGPSLDHAARLARHPAGRGARLLRQQVRSWYVGFFCLPVLPELVLRAGHRQLAQLVTAAEGLPPDHWGPELRDNAVNGLNLYRANVPGRLAHPRTVHTDVPVLVVHPSRDRYVTALATEDLDSMCSLVRVDHVDAGHWAQVTHPDRVAALVLEQVSGTDR